ncbi:MAG: hypothetical protein Q9169_002414 [Polycauliona sp. 2 TL-2023]
MEAYANTPKEILETINYLQELKSKVVKPADNDNECCICLEPFSSSDEGHGNNVSLPSEMPDTVTKLRARLETFDEFFVLHPETARPNQTQRLRRLLWEYSNTTVVVQEEYPGAKVEAQAAISSRFHLPLDLMAPPYPWLHEATLRHDELRAQVTRRRHQRYETERLRRDQERARYELSERTSVALESARALEARLRDREAQRIQLLTPNNFSPRGVRAGLPSPHFDLGSEHNSNELELPPSIRSTPQPPGPARTRIATQGVQQAQSDSILDTMDDWQTQLFRDPMRPVQQQQIHPQWMDGSAQSVRATRQQTELLANGLYPPGGWYASWIRDQQHQPAPTPAVGTGRTGEAPPFSLFPPPYSGRDPQRDTAPTTAAQPDPVLTREQRLDDFERSLAEREVMLNHRHDALEARSRDIIHREALLARRSRVHGRGLPAHPQQSLMDEVD